MAKSFVSIPIGYKRTDDRPLVYDQLFYSLADAQRFATDDPTAYPGLITSVVEGNDVRAYIIKKDFTLAEICTYPVSYLYIGNKPSIEGVELNGNRSLNEFGIKTESQIQDMINTSIEAQGHIFELKGTVDSVADLPQEGNIPGDVYLVPGTNNQVEEWVWTPEGVWERLGIVIEPDLSAYPMRDEMYEYVRTELSVLEGTLRSLIEANAAAIIASKEETIQWVKDQQYLTEVPIASREVAGIVKVGPGLDISDDGVLVTDGGKIQGVEWDSISHRATINGNSIKSSIDDVDNTSADLGIDGTTVNIDSKEGTGIKVNVGEGNHIGLYKDGQEIPADTPFNEVLKNILTQRVAPKYEAPVFKIHANGLETSEVGTESSITIVPEILEGDAGQLTSYVLYQEGDLLVSSSSIEDAKKGITIPFQYEDEEVTFNAFYNYSEGGIKEDNLGDPYPEGHIMAGTLKDDKSYSGYRKAWFKASSTDILATSSNEIRSLESNGGRFITKKDSQIRFDFDSGMKYFVIAIPGTWGYISEIMQESTNLDIKSSFVITDVYVRGANDYKEIPYKVYKLTTLAPMDGDSIVIMFK